MARPGRLIEGRKARRRSPGRAIAMYANGAEYAMFVPPAWNGRLILYAHGFVDPDAAIALPDAAPADVAPWVVQLRETLLSAGYAVAYSSYAENGWAVKNGAARTHELRDLFSSRFGAPTHVYLMGRSLGGLITVFLAENFPGAYQGALALCGPLGGGRLETDYIGNVRVLFDHFFPGVIPGDVLHVPEMEYSADSSVVKAIVAAILANPQKAVALASVDQIKLPYTTWVSSSSRSCARSATTSEARTTSWLEPADNRRSATSACCTSRTATRNCCRCTTANRTSTSARASPPEDHRI